MRTDERRFLVSDFHVVEIPDIDLGEAVKASVFVDLQCSADESALVDDLFREQFLFRSHDVISGIQDVVLGFYLPFERGLFGGQSADLRIESRNLLGQFGDLDVHVFEILFQNFDFLVFRFDLGVQLRDQLLETADFDVRFFKLVGRLLQPGDRLPVGDQQLVDRFDVLVDLRGGSLRDLAFVDIFVDDVFPGFDCVQILGNDAQRRENFVEYGIFLGDDYGQRIVLAGQSLGFLSARAGREQQQREEI